jgi:hypothetical protein
MAPTEPMNGEPEACPYLGLPDDPRTRFAFATPAHRCHVKRKPSVIALSHQGSYCLSSDFQACNRFRAPAATVGARTEAARLPGAGVPSGLREAPSVASSPPESTISLPGPSADPRSRPPTLTPIVTVVSSSGLRNRVERGDTSPTRNRRVTLRHGIVVVLVLLAAAMWIAVVLTGTIAPR